MNMRPGLILLSGVVIAMAFGVPSDAVAKSSHRLDPIPCADPRGCPDLVVDDLTLLRNSQRVEEFTPHDCAVKEKATKQGERRILRFTFSSPNIGDGSLIVGGPLENPDYFVWDKCHRHYHFVEYADYRLWTIQGYKEWDEKRNEDPEKTAQEVLRENPRLKHEFVAGHKQGFCMIDVAEARVTKYGIVVDPDPRTYGHCGTNQGISRGWADVYLQTLPGQWIDVTHVEDGVYMLEAEVNAEQLFEESSYTNNRAAVPVPVGVDRPMGPAPPQIIVPLGQ